MNAVKRDGNTFEFASRTLKDDRDVAQAALDNVNRADVADVLIFVNRDLREQLGYSDY